MAGEPERACLPPAIPLWSVLLVPQAQGAGVPQHCLDQ